MINTNLETVHHESYLIPTYKVVNQIFLGVNCYILLFLLMKLLPLTRTESKMENMPHNDGCIFNPNGTLSYIFDPLGLL